MSFNYLTIGLLTGIFIGLPSAIASGDISFAGIAALSGSVAVMIRDVDGESKEEEEEENQAIYQKIKTLEDVIHEYPKMSEGYNAEIHGELLELVQRYKQKAKV